MMSGNNREIVSREGGDDSGDWLTLGEAARHLGVAQSTVRKWTDRGRLATFKTPGGHRQIQKEDLARFKSGNAGDELTI